MKKDFVMPVLVLSIICLLVSGALSFVNDVTRPVIEEAAALRAETARREVMPHADEFVLLELEDLPKTITEVFGTTNNVGFVFMINTAGYGGEIRIICAIDPEGKIIKTTTLAHTETMGIATPVFEQEREYVGKDKNLEGIDVISGATITWRAYRNSIRDAFEVFEKIRGTRL